MVMLSTSFALLLLSLTAACAWAASTLAPCVGFLQCWLASLVFHIPDQSITIPASPLPGAIVITLDGFQCVGVNIHAIDSSLDANAPVMSIDADGIGTTCTGTWGVIYGFIQGSGGVQATISQTELKIAAALLSDDGEFATSALARNCALQLNLQLTFTGTDILVGILEIFENAISALLNKKIPATVCTALSSLIDVNVTAALQNLNAELKATVLQPPAPLPPLPAQPFLDWRSSPLFSALDAALNGLLLSHTGTINCLLRKFLFPNGVDSLTVAVMPPGTNSTTVVPGLGVLTVFVPNVTLTGLDTFTSIQLLHAAEDVDNLATVRTALALAWLNVSVNVMLWADPFEIITGQTLYESFQVNVSLQDPTLLVDMELAFRADWLDAMRVDQLFPDPYKIPNGMTKR